MGLKTTLSFTCDYSECKVGQTGPAVVQWCKEEAEKSDSAMPEEAKYLVIISQNGVLKTFCCQLHAAEYFLPPGYEAVQKKVIELPKKPEPEEITPKWAIPPGDGRTVISRSENEAIPQPDGYSGPDEGPGGGRLDNE